MFQLIVCHSDHQQLLSVLFFLFKNATVRVIDSSLFSMETIKLVVVGDKGVGKTALLWTFTSGCVLSFVNAMTPLLFFSRAL